MANQPQSAQQQQHAMKQAETALQQLGQAHGLMGINWGAITPLILPLILQLVQTIAQSGGVTAQQGQQQQTP